jgi:pyruvate,water dikinase
MFLVLYKEKDKTKMKYIKKFDQIGSDQVSEVGGKNASLGEMISKLKDQGIRIPDGFATTSEAYWEVVRENDIQEKLKDKLNQLDKGNLSLDKAGKQIRRLFTHAQIPPELEEEIRKAYQNLSKQYDSDELDVAVRSSATAEDLPEASFAGQQETFLNVTGEKELLDACCKCYASLFTDRAITYRKEKGFDHLKIALSIGVQKMVRADKAGSGVMFSLDTETGFRDVVVINAAWGLGENVVQGAVNPDEYRVFKPLLSKKKLMPDIQKELGSKEKKMIYAKGGSKDTKNVNTSKKERSSFVLNHKEILKLARWASVVEKHYDQPMDMEWAKDGESNELFILQARPETVQSLKTAGQMKTFRLKEKGRKILDGLAIGEAVAAGKSQVIKDPDEIGEFKKDAILVTGQTDPDWVPIMKKASGIVTDHGGRTSHAAIVSRELGIPAVVGTEYGTSKLKDGKDITLSCAEGDRGIIYDGILDFEEKELDLEKIPETQTQIMMNIASPAAAFRWWRLPTQGVGLARMEFIINSIIKIHPMALVNLDSLKDKKAQKQIQDLTQGFENKEDYFVEHLSQGIAQIAAPHYPDPVIVRMSDFKTNEYANLIGGREFEQDEANPMLGFRGASRYYSKQYKEGFKLECRGIKQVRNEIGLTNVIIMIPFCRSLEEADKVLDVLAEFGLERGKNGLEVYVMIEIPSNVILAEEFAKRFDGFSIGTNDLTQLVLGVDRDSEELSHIYDERNEAVKSMLRQVIDLAHKHDTKVGLCGQAPSDHPDFASFLVEAGIDSISLNPDSIIKVKEKVRKKEKAKQKT